MVMDGVFIGIHIIFAYFLRPLFFGRESQWESFVVVYTRVLEPPYTLIMLVLFEDIPAYVKRRKDRIFSRERLKAKIVRPLLQIFFKWLERLL